MTRVLSDSRTAALTPADAARLLGPALPAGAPLAVGDPMPAGLDPYHLRLEATTR